MITICSVVYNDTSTKLFDYMVKSVIKFTDHLPQFIISDNGKNDLIKYKSMPNFTIIPNNSKSIGSLQHGESLNDIIKLSKTKYTAIIESDCVVVDYDWYKTKSKLMAAKKGEHSGASFYHVCFMVFETEYLKNIDFRPGKNNRTNRSYKPHEDVGWQIRGSDDIELLKFVDCKQGSGIYINSKFQSDEFWRNGKAVLLHFGRGSGIKNKAIRKGFDHPIKQLENWKKILNGILNE